MKEILLPATVLIIWTLIMAFWMLADRGRIMKANKVNLDNERSGARGAASKPSPLPAPTGPVTITIT